MSDQIHKTRQQQEISRRVALELGGIAIATAFAPNIAGAEARGEVRNIQLTQLLNDADNYIKSNTERWLKEYVGPFLAIQSISERGENRDIDEMRWIERKRALTFLASKLEKLGVSGNIYDVDNGEKNSARRKRNAFLVGHRNSKNPRAFTLLQYGHADVKPETPVLKSEDKWEYSPTQFVERDRRIEDYIQEVELDIGGKKVKDRQICARGAADDKGQLLTYLFAAETYLAVAQEIPINLKFLFEIGEETGSPLGKEFVRRNANLLKSDAIILEDASGARYNVPFISYWLRGIIKGNIRVKTAKNSGHSGGKSFLPNPLEYLSRIISQLEDPETGKISFSEAYDGIRPLTEEESFYFRKQLSCFNADEVKKKFALHGFAGEVDYNPLVRTTQRPTLDIHNISGGSNSTLIPNEAEAYFTMRIVPDQDPIHVFKGLEEKLRVVAKNLGLNESEVEVVLNEYDMAFSTDLKHSVFKVVSDSLMTGYGVNEIDYLMEGGTEPISSAFKQYLRVPVIMTGCGDPDSNSHAKNERFLVDYGLVKGVRSNIAMFYNLAKSRSLG